MSQTGTEFHPDYAQENPGAYLEWILDSNGIKRVELAKRCGRPTKTISEIISGKASITPDTALQLERVLGVSASIWVRLECHYQLQTAKVRAKNTSHDSDARKWARCFPISEMKKHGFVGKPKGDESLANYLLRYFRVSSVQAWDKFWHDRVNLARLKQNQHHDINRCAVAAWLNQGERLASSIETTRYSESEFRDTLKIARELTRQGWEDSAVELVERCRGVGVAVALVPYLSKTGLRGAAFWATKDKAVILLSDHNKSEASVWFTFFHEAAHILLHSKKKIFVDQENDGSADVDVEREADTFSAELLIPQRTLNDVLTQNTGKLTSKWLASTAEQIGVGPDLLLARLQHEDRIKRNSTFTKTYRRRLEFDKCVPFT